MGRLFNRPTTAPGVAAGTKRPVHDVISKPGTPASIIVGTSGSDGQRWAVVTASGRTLAERIAESAPVAVSIIIDTCPLSTSGIAVPPPL